MALRSQTPLPLGIRDVAWPNTTGQGSSALNSRVYYPATSAGSNTPVLPRAGGWPVVVFLHGFATPGTSYGPLATAWAQRGYVVVLNNTATFDNVGQERDGRALYSAVVAAAASGPFQAAFDLSRIGLAGHSMGGGNVANILANNPGYRAGVALAPVTPRTNNGALVQVPMGIVVGTGDTITPAGSNAQPYFNQFTDAVPFATLHLLNNDCNHTNIAGLFLSGRAANAVFARVTEVALGVLGHAMDTAPTALEGALGDDTLQDARLVSLQQRFALPQVWAAGELRLGRTTRWSVAAEPGLGGAAAAFALAAPVSTPVGTLRLDQGSLFLALVGVLGAERRLDASTAVPASSSFLGLPFHLQALGATVSVPLLLGGVASLAVLPNQ